MPILRRKDGDLVEDVSPIRRLLPFLMPTRTEAFALYRQRLEAGRAKSLLARLNAGRPAERPVTLFILLMRAASFVLSEYPRLNRFLAGGRLYQRRGIWLSFSAKQSKNLDAPVFNCKRRFDPREDFNLMVEDIYRLLESGRLGRATATDKQAQHLLRLPAPVLRLGIRIIRRLYHWNCLPQGMIQMDPLYTSIFGANLGSLGLDAVYHHNFEYGNTPIFAVVGRVHRAPVVTADGDIEAREVFEIAYTYDERVEDGFYCLAALSRLKELIEETPEQLVEGATV